MDASIILSLIALIASIICIVIVTKSSVRKDFQKIETTVKEHEEILRNSRK